jgi:hypothetical protein
MNSRELRVLGRLEGGEIGYFSKQIDEDDEMWTFKHVEDETERILLKERFQTSVKLPTNKMVAAHSRPSEDKFYVLTTTDRKTKDKCLVTNVTIRNFNAIASPCEMQMTFDGHKMVNTILHTRRAIPKKDGGKNHDIMMMYWGTIIFPKECCHEGHIAHEFLSRTSQPQFRCAVDVHVEVKMGKSDIISINNDNNVNKDNELWELHLYQTPKFGVDPWNFALSMKFQQVKMVGIGQNDEI